MKLDWKVLAPEGVSAKKEAVWTGAAVAASTLWSLTFFLRLRTERATAEPESAAGRVVSLMSFQTMLGTALLGFYLVALGMAVLAMWHYAKLRQNAKKERVLDPREAHWRALTMLVLGLCAAVAADTVVYFVYRAAFSNYREHLSELFSAALHLEG